MKQGKGDQSATVSYIDIAKGVAIHKGGLMQLFKPQKTYPEMR